LGIGGECESADSILKGKEVREGTLGAPDEEVKKSFSESGEGKKAYQGSNYKGAVQEQRSGGSVSLGTII